MKPSSASGRHSRIFKPGTVVSPFAEARSLIITLVRERWAQSTKKLASTLDTSADTVTFTPR
jgi:hypothetical protein